MTKAFAANREIIPIARFFLPAILAAKQADIRSEWTFAMLRIFEEMRLHAATHDGQWPEPLAPGYSSDCHDAFSAVIDRSTASSKSSTTSGFESATDAPAERARS
jgi:hypothetical protein